VESISVNVSEKKSNKSVTESALKYHNDYAWVHKILLKTADCFCRHHYLKPLSVDFFLLTTYNMGWRFPADVLVLHFPKFRVANLISSSYLTLLGLNNSKLSRFRCLCNIHKTSAQTLPLSLRNYAMHEN